jgi:MFS family permease
VALSETFLSFKYRNYRLYFFGQAISLVGTWMQRIAISWLLYRLTNSAFILGVNGFAALIPTMLLSPIAGTITDRFNRYKILLTTQVASMIQAGVLAVLIMVENYNISFIILLSALLGIINAFDIPSRQALVTQLIEDKKDIPNAIGLNSSMVNMARLVGPALAGIVLSAWGESACFLINFFSFLAVLVSLLLMRIRPLEVQLSSKNVIEGLREGYDYLKKASGMRFVILMLACTGLFVLPYATLLPVFAKDVLNGDEFTFSLLNSFGGLGALIGAFYLASNTPDRNIIKVIRAASLMFFISLILFSFTSSLWLSLFFLTSTTFGMVILVGASNTFIQTNVDEQMRGRVLSYYVMAFQGMQPFGSILIGFIATKIGAPLTVLFQGVAGIIIFIIFIPYIRRTRLRQEVKIRWARKEIEDTPEIGI